eukprot:scaffold56400_cov21-Tisochrysis_lutea.AAC.1
MAAGSVCDRNPRRAVALQNTRSDRAIAGLTHEFCFKETHPPSEPASASKIVKSALAEPLTMFSSAWPVGFLGRPDLFPSYASSNSHARSSPPRGVPGQRGDLEKEDIVVGPHTRISR